MSDQATARTRPPADGLQALRLLALAAVAAGVGLLAAAAFVLSYTGIHAVALYAGVPPRLARIYPLIFDAMLIVACAAVLSLRGAGLPSRCYAWLSMLVLLVTAATADTLHAIGTRLPPKPTAAAVAIIPWALVLIGFGLLLCMLRQARLRQAAADGEEGLPERSGQAEVATGLDALFGPKESGVPRKSGVPQEPAGAQESRAGAAGAAAPQQPPAARQPPAEAAGTDAPVTAEADPAADSMLDLAIDTEPGQDDPASDEGSTWTPRTREQQPAGVSPGYNGGSASAFNPAPTMSPVRPPTSGSEYVGSPDEDEKGSMPLIEAGTDEPEAKAGPEAKTRPEAQAAPEPEAMTGPEPKTGPEAQAGAEPEAKNEPGAENESGPGTETSSEPSAETEAGATALAEPGPGAENESEAEAGPEPGADPAPVLAAAAQFDRLRSSPAPPGV
jgi:Protein of unknown function (DUF2637)